jgi:RNA-directed DNA polymerase
MDEETMTGKPSSSVVTTPKQREENTAFEPVVWTSSMLKALRDGVKGGKWHSLIDKVYAPKTLNAAFERVSEKKGAAGVDHVSIEHYRKRLPTELSNLHETLRAGTYRPSPVRRVEIPKPGTTKKRPLGIPTVRDRVVQAAVHKVVEPIFEQTFSPASYGFRPGRGAKDALREVERLIKYEGHEVVVDIDIEAFFDTVDHARVMHCVGEQIADRRLLALIESFLAQPTQHSEEPPSRGMPQGGVISPLLSNIYLNDLDHLVTGQGGNLVRYADDIVVLCRTVEDAQRVLTVVTAWMTEVKLTLHPTKTCIVDTRIPRSSFCFLGYEFVRTSKGKLLRKPRKSSLKKLRDKVRNFSRRTSGCSLKQTIEKLNPILRGWFEYFKHSHPSELIALDSWIRMRLRSILRHQRKMKGRGRGADHRRWPNNFFMNAGLFSLTQARAHAISTR